MRLRHIKGAEEEIANSPFVVQDPAAFKGRWCELFGNSNPVHIEIGMGKGVGRTESRNQLYWY